METQATTPAPDGEIVAAMSGGVDSSVAALLLARAGARVRGLFMKNWRDDDPRAACEAREDFVAAAAAADVLKIDLEVADFSAQYRERVFAPFLAATKRGDTPNPDVLCNSQIKFGALLDYARAAGATAVATGHYARIEESEDGPRLLKGEDSAKDQSYFLHRLSRAQLARARFPLGGMLKREVRAVARAAGLGNWDRKDSVGICFVGRRRFDDFLARFVSETPGEIIAVDGEVIGRHRGLGFYTIGQRQGLKIGGRGQAWFVAGKDRAANRLLVAQGADHPSLFCARVEIADCHWIAASPRDFSPAAAAAEIDPLALPRANWVYAARLRHRQEPASCALDPVTSERATIHFPQPQRAAAPGQYGVIYDGNVCLGGGVVCEPGAV